MTAPNHGSYIANKHEHVYLPVKNNQSKITMKTKDVHAVGV